MKTMAVVRGVAVLACALVCLGLAGAAWASDEPEGLMEVKLAKESQPLAKDVESGIDHLFDVLRDSAVPFDPSRIDTMLDFVVNNSNDPKDIEPAKRLGGRGICLRRDIKTDLRSILRYFYNPDIPNFLLCPAVLRLSGWHEGSQFLERETPLWDELDTLDAPVISRGKEFESCTPDSFAEAYYRYDINRLIILMKYQGKNVLVSVSEQADKSDVGRKGAILDDQEWDYFYSGIEGLNRGMIGWMDTFMYKSGSVLIFAEQDAAAPRSTTFLFKWLNAGWAGMNVVKRRHIYDGTLRYARSLAKVLESETLTPEIVIKGMEAVQGLDEVQIDYRIRQYAKAFEARFKDNPKLEKKEYAKIIKDGGYSKVLDADARKSIIALETFKSLLGMESLIDTDTSPSASAEAPAQPES